MKIGIFTECYKPVMNGVAVSIETFRKSLEEKGHEVFIFAPDNKEAINDDHVYRFPAVVDKKKRLYPVTFPSLEIMKTYLPEEICKDLDIVHAQHMFTMGRLARYVAEEYNKPLVYTYHTLIAEYTHYAGIFSWVVKKYLKNMSKRFCNSCDQIITPSNPMKKILLGYGIKSPIEVIMTGIDPKNYGRLKKEEAAKLKKEFKIKDGDKILLYLSRVAKEKNIPFLLKAFVKIQKQYPDCHLLMVGGGPEEEEIKTISKNLEIKKITFTGMVPKEKANRIFGLADVFTFPSVTETQGIVVTEAMAAGTPPVAINKMGPTDIISNGKDGFLTKLNLSDFVEKTLKLLKDDKLHEKFVSEGRKNIKNFSTETSVNKMLSLYERVVDQTVFNEKKAFKKRRI